MMMIIIFVVSKVKRVMMMMMMMVITIVVVSKVKRVSQSLADCPRWESEEEVGRRGWVSIIIITHFCDHHQA